MSHRNARTTFQGRLLIVQRHRAGWPQAHIAKAMGISRQCVKKWIDRYAAEGEAGLHDRSSRPHTCPRRTSSSGSVPESSCRAWLKRCAPHCAASWPATSNRAPLPPTRAGG